MELSRRFHWRGRTVAWERLGNGPAVVMCHGTPWSSQVWVAFAEALAHDFSVYLWDMPGYGQSSKQPDHAVDLGTQAELLDDLLRHWDLPAPHVVAHDYGGAVSLRAHLLHGATYASLALIDVVALRPWGSDFFRLVADNTDVFAGQPHAVHRGALEAYIAGASHRGLTAEQMHTVAAPWLSPEGQDAFYRQIAAADERFTDEIQDRYPELGLPVKIIWGSEDTWIPVDRATRLSEAIRDADLEIIDGAGHLVHYDAPVHLAVALQRWLAHACS
ncbi:pimeloyl-ACP methyl ester carboxylesterase [Halopolyspora algeriensis]|uniref:Pimeloyl-ACP methyl ester carboxylesterase n=1 Tax=Halopolyspora algeriensis TaxID=1500506 RepID=A0A368VFY6_9ACTN|nr:alpha/beta fold hydrolase [Halopolyspora algeriensis]RCW40060.1 pimeloyl-ACP methyl ester carboxylesterase [Halopolyspora algeriensis]TQM56791.1 pimeloyl-ACP methyl ester carboxylesterase [Halopolyspora algeriensis]